MLSQVQVFTLALDANRISGLYCPLCKGEPQDIIEIGTIIPTMVIGDHAFELTAYQCYQCQQIVVEVIDDFDNDLTNIE